MQDHDSLANVLYIDLTKKSFRIENRKELFDQYIGGAGVATQLLHENCPQGIDAYDEASPIILAVGPLTGVLPLASKTIAMYKSPHTGDFGESHAGGRSAVAIRMAGYGAIVITGKCDFPIYLSIHDHKVYFRDATTLWGMRSCFTAARVMRERENFPGHRAIMRIGQAGERLVSYASVTTETYRHFGRLGLGAVFGSKMLKGIVVSGKRSIPIVDKKAFRALYDEVYNAAVASPVMKKYHDLGTAENISKLNSIHGLPSMNLKQSSIEGIENITGENIAQHFLGRRFSCAHCPVSCIHVATLREPYEDDPYFYKTTFVGYDYELIYSLGAMLGITDVNKMLILIDKVEELSIDAMSTGVVMAWATEMQESGLISDKETDGIFLKWGDHLAYAEFLKKIIRQPNDFYKAVARGVDHASNIYGGKDIALTFGKNEMAGYHTGPGAYIGYLIGARHSHLDNAGYSVDINDLINAPLSAEAIVDKLVDEEALRQILSSIAICFFARGIYKMDIVARALAFMGYPFDAAQLKEIGQKIHAEKFRFKVREGFSYKDQHIPERILTTPDPTSLIKKELITDALAYFSKKMGIDNTPD
jgi:aldehyde:ferredoxin oxidoreductase